MLRFVSSPALQPDHPDLPRGHPAHLHPDPADPRRSRSSAGWASAASTRSAIAELLHADRPRPAAAGAVRRLCRQRAAAAISAARSSRNEPVLSEFFDAVPGDARALGLRHAVRDRDRPAGRHARRGASAARSSTTRVMGVSLTGYSMPIFWWGLLLILLFSRQSRLDAGLRAHRRSTTISSRRHRLHADRRAALRPGGRLPLGAAAI